MAVTDVVTWAMGAAENFPVGCTEHKTKDRALHILV